jgi:hypothetical protein
MELVDRDRLKIATRPVDKLDVIGLSPGTNPEARR